MKSTDRNAKSGMVTFVVVLSVIAAVLVSAYLPLRPPGEVSDAPASPHAIDQSPSQ
ncbi:hypothetical protein [Rhizobium sp. PDO1-076]|uniref:hypothetical protein n=1 Tax=Rhizobium sp. PDO1-076 TaxID=1125979 RepID=UPI001360B323|nr:hypothetical protein [Rhizobium sp. PDO1-076]